jgi:hypothetical protein
MDLLRNPRTGQRIVDYVTVQEPANPEITFQNVNVPPREFAFATGEPRDFRPDDGELHIRSARMSVNGKVDTSTSGSNIEISGVVVWFYLPKRGRFLLSLTPHPDLGFRKAGEVRGSKLSFTIGSDTFNLVAGGAIAPTQSAFNLYLLHDPTWKPDYRSRICPRSRWEPLIVRNFWLVNSPGNLSMWTTLRHQGVKPGRSIIVHSVAGTNSV